MTIGVNLIGSYEQIMNALLAYLKAQIPANTFLTFRRGVVQWQELGRVVNGVPIMRQPALFLYDGPGFGGGRVRYEQRSRSLPVIRILHRTVIIYQRTPAAGGFPGGSLGGSAVQSVLGSQASPLHPLIEAVELAMETPDDAAQGALTLGGLVSHCFIEGDGLQIPPDIDPEGQGMATLPITILVPHGPG